MGLPLAIMLASKGKQVCVYDVNEKGIALIKSGVMPFVEEGAEPLLQQELAAGRLHFSTRPEVVSDSETAVLIIGTPVDKHLNPNFSVLREVIAELVPHFYDGQLLVLRSTVYPGLSKRINDWLTEAGKNVHVAFCPERILEGKALEELESLPQIISSFTEEGVRRAADLFSLLIRDLVVVQPMEAELAKLFTNSWRYLKFAVANQFYMIANDYNLDFYNIYYAMTHNYARTKDFPRPGFAAGPCLFKDTMQLAAFNNNNFHLGHTAMLINEGLPNYVVSQLKKQYTLSEKTIGILGMAFKAESDDARESLSYKLKKILVIEAKQVLCADPYVNDPTLVDEKTLIRDSDIVIIAAPHKRYKDLNIQNKKVVDIWNILNNGGKI